MTPTPDVRNWESAAKERKSRGRIVLVAGPPGGDVSRVINCGADVALTWRRSQQDGGPIAFQRLASRL